MLIALFVKLKKTKAKAAGAEKKQLHLFFCIINPLIIASDIGVGFADLSHCLLPIVAGVDFLDYTEDVAMEIIIFIADIFYFISTLSLYILFIGRLFISFKGTMYEISKLFLGLMGVLILITAGNMIKYLVPISQTLAQREISIIVLSINEVIITIILCITFIYKLKKLVVMQSNGAANVESDISGISLTNSQQRMLYLITKHSILSILMVVFNLIFYSCLLYEIEIYISNFTVAVEYGLRSLEMTLICFLLYLSFGFNDRLYVKICKICHSFCYKKCLTDSKKNIHHQYYQMM